MSASCNILLVTLRATQLEDFSYLAVAKGTSVCKFSDFYKGGNGKDSSETILNANYIWYKAPPPPGGYST